MSAPNCLAAYLEHRNLAIAVVVCDHENPAVDHNTARSCSCNPIQSFILPLGLRILQVQYLHGSRTKALQLSLRFLAEGWQNQPNFGTEVFADSTFS